MRQVYAGVMSGTSLDGVDAAQFNFIPPAGARKLDYVDADVIGDMSLEAGE